MSTKLHIKNVPLECRGIQLTITNIVDVMLYYNWNV